MAETIKPIDLKNRALISALYKSLLNMYWFKRGGLAQSFIEGMYRQGRWGRRLLKKFIPLLEKDIHLSKSSTKHSLTALRAHLIHCSTPPPAVLVSLPNTETRFRSQTRKLLAEASSRKDFDSRHIIARFKSKEIIEAILNSLADADEQADYLALVGRDPDGFGGDIHKAARKWQIDCNDNPDNLFKGARGPNRAKGARHEAMDLPPWETNQDVFLAQNFSDIIGKGEWRHDPTLRQQASILTARIKSDLELIKKQLKG